MIKRVATAVVLIPVVLLIVFRAPLWLFAAVVTLVAGIATCEYLRLAEASGLKPAKIATYFLTGLLFASAIAAFVAEVKLARLPSTALLRNVLPKQHPYLYFTLNAASLARDFLLLTALVLLVAMLASEDLRSALAGAAVSALALVYVSLPFLLLITVRARAAGAFYVFYLLVVVWVGDILAFLIGGPLGKHKLAPRISPNKSWEGTLASLAGATALGTVILLGAEGIVSFARSSHLLAPPWGSILSVGAYPTPRPIWVYVLFSAAINIAAQLGDLVESMIKRGAGVKDSGSLLPGHGGMLDRIDALLFAAPVLWYYAQIAAAISPR